MTDTETVGDAIGMGEQTTGLPELEDKARRHAFETVDQLRRSHPVETVASVENSSFSPGMGTGESQRRDRKLCGIEMTEQKPQPIAVAAMRLEKGEAIGFKKPLLDFRLRFHPIPSDHLCRRRQPDQIGAHDSSILDKALRAGESFHAFFSNRSNRLCQFAIINEPHRLFRSKSHSYLLR